MTIDDGRFIGYWIGKMGMASRRECGKRSHIFIDLNVERA